MNNWSRYLESICNAYAQWWQIYTITDVVGQKRVEAEPSPFLFDFGLMVQMVEPDRGERGKGEEKVERLTVLEGLRKYASEHVLLVGRPGSGKSTALARLLLEEAREARTPLNPLLAREAGGVKIPVLVELRYYRTSILDLIQDFLQRHDPNLTVDAETLKTWLRQGQLLLLVDGLNELPSEEAWRDLHKLRQDYQKTTPMIFTTRDLGVGGDLDIAKKLEMQPLTEGQMQQFVHAYLPQQGEQMLRQLGSRLREFGQTPLLLWMLCSVFRAMGKVPPNLGLVFRQFALSYDHKLKQDIPISKESRRWWHRLLEQLAWVMTSGEAKTELQVAISKQKAEAVLTEFLAGKVAHPEDCALCWLEDLLNHHLIQLGAGDQIEFRHQLIQEYYTAESLLKLLPSLGNDQLKREYLNYLKWTEPLVLMLELVEDEVQAVRVVKLALEVDLRLGARLAGAVKPEFQAQTIDLIANLKIPQPLKIRLLGTTQSINTISHLSKAFKENKHQPQFCRRIVWALAQVGRATIPIIREQALKHEHIKVRYEAVYALGQIGSEAVIPALRQALEDKAPEVTIIAKNVLVIITNEATINTLVKALEDKSFEVRKEAVRALGSMAGEVAIPYLERALKDEKMAVRYTAILELEKIRSEAVILPLIRALADKEFEVCRSAAEALK